jgi:hypothetical protein
MWATDIWFLNDQKEVKVAMELAESILVEDRVTAATRFHLGLYETLINSLQSVRESRVYVASFSEEGDLLSQWRGYSPRASGYSIGFLSRRLIHAGQLEPNFFLVPCVYSESKQRELMASLVKDVLAAAEEDHRKNPDHPTDTYKKAFQLFTRLMAIIGPTFKDPSFEEEQEWRAVSMPGSVDLSMLEFRLGRYHLIPYCKFSLERTDNRLELMEIVVGPTPDFTLAESAAEMMLGAFSVRYEMLTASAIPYRHW